MMSAVSASSRVDVEGIEALDMIGDGGDGIDEL